MKLRQLLDSARLERSLKRAVEREERFIPGTLEQNTSSSPKQGFPSFYPVESRAETLQWLRRLTYAGFGFSPDTFSLAVNVFDRFLSIVKVQSKHLRCIAAASLLIAAKICQEPENEPSAKEIVSLGQCGFKEGDITRMERIILDKLHWDVDASTPLTILNILHALASSWGYLSSCGLPPLVHLGKVTNSLETCMLDSKFACFKPSALALAVLSNELRQLSDCDWLDATMELQSSASVSGRTLGVYYEAVQASQFKLPRKAAPKPAFSRPAFVPRALFSSSPSVSKSVHPLSGGSAAMTVPAATPVNSLPSSRAISSDDEISDADSSSSDEDVSHVAPPKQQPLAASIPSDLSLSAAACVLLSSCASAASPCALSTGCAPLERPHVLSSPVKVA
ncbi:cyclin-I-like [Sycon ciliatum]|uniref:cyclin-I-like n=1 Tax=Sycon ciliatum TaxID=27933 RepID=UPI0020AB36DD